MRGFLLNCIWVWGAIESRKSDLRTECICGCFGYGLVLLAQAAARAMPETAPTTWAFELERNATSKNHDATDDSTHGCRRIDRRSASFRRAPSFQCRTHAK